MHRAMRSTSAPKQEADQQKAASNKQVSAYRRLRNQADAQMAAQQTQEATNTLRAILRLQHLAQLK